MKIKPVTQTQYGYWLVLSSPIKKDGKYFVKALCTGCNKTKKLVQKNRLLNGTSKSCGCVQQNKIGDFWKGKKAHNKVGIFQKESKIIYNNYKFNAKKRNLAFELSLKEFQNFLDKPCVYCGTKNSNHKNTSKGVFKYNGVDRWDNQKGYVIDNCLPSCVRCNRMKGNLTDGSKFIEHIKGILHYHSNDIIFDEKSLINMTCD